MNREERAFLEKKLTSARRAHETWRSRLRKTGRPVVIFCFSVGAVVACSVIVSTLGTGVFDRTHASGVFLTLGCFLFGAMFLQGDGAETDSLIRSILRDLDGGKVQFDSFFALAAVAVLDEEDEALAPSHFLETAGNKVLFIESSNHIFDAWKNRQFPNERFEVVRFCYSDETYSLKCDGASLPVSQTTFQKLGLGKKQPRNFSIVEGNLGNLHEALLRAPPHLFTPVRRGFISLSASSPMVEQE